MSSFGNEVIEAAKRERELKLTTFDRKSGKPHDVTIWASKPGKPLTLGEQASFELMPAE
jgi:hypothetical protein